MKQILLSADGEWGKQVIEIALQYANHEWTATEQNVLHGFDPDGIPVDTPDVTWKGEVLHCGWWKVGEINKGVAYGWGNASTIEEFDAGLTEGKLAGNVPEDKSRMGSKHSVGVDCSGLLTRCWELPKKIATRDIPKFANKIALEEIRQGDVLAKVGSHVMFFIEFTDDEKKRVKIVDSTRSTGKVSVREMVVDELFAEGYEVYRKKDTMILPDYHVHTSYSPDSKMDPEEAICAAMSSGVTEICFTEHMDLGHHMEMYDQVPDFKGMEETISKLKEKYPEINIRKGIEVGYITETVKQTAKVLSEQRFDYVLLSTHCVEGLDCGLPESKRGQDKITAYKKYLETVYTSVADDRLSKYYDCVSHIGYIAKGLHYEENSFPYEMFPELFDKILSEIIKRGKGIEVNTSGIDRGGHVLPHPSVIRRYRELGGRIITIGSDAHRSENVGAYIKDAVAIIANAGFEEITLFKNREPRFVKIV